MFAARSSLKVMLVSLGLVAGLACGGGGGSSAGPSPIPEPTNKVTLVLPPPSRVGGGSYWVACQDGQGAWRVLTGVPSGPTTTTYSFQVDDPSGRYGLAVVNLFPVGGETGIYGILQQLTLAETRTLDYSAWGPVTSVTAMGTVSGLGPADGARIATTGGSKTLTPGMTLASLTASAGASDFLAVRLPAMGPADALVLRRGYPVPSTGPVNIGFHFPDGWMLVPQSCSVNGLAPTEELTLSAEWRTPTTPIKLAEATTSPMAFKAVPPERMQAGDLHILAATARDSTALTHRHALAYSLSAVGINLPLPSACPVPTFGTGSGSTYYRPTLAWTALDGALVHDVLIGDVYKYLEWSIHLSRGWLGSSTSPAYGFPDFSTLAGWNGAWGLPFGRDLYWNFSQRQSTHPDPGFYFDGPRSFLAGHSAWESMRYGGLNLSAPSTSIQPDPSTVEPRSLKTSDGRPYLRSRSFG